MNLNEYQTLAMRTDSKYENQKNRLLNGVMGLNGEAGETIDIVKKHLFQGHELDSTKLIEELGDILWYIALCADTMDISLDDIAEMNIAKLKKRYPDGFKEEDSINRQEKNVNQNCSFQILRESLGFSRRKIEKLSGINARTLYRYEHGLSKPTFTMIDRLSKAMNVSKEIILESFRNVL